jgi:uncharacterized membrane protein
MAKRYKKNKGAPVGLVRPVDPSRQIEPRPPRVEFTQTFTTGPLPDPELLEKYNTIITNGAERIMSMAEKQSEHRQTLEKIVIGSDVNRQNWGVIAGFVLTVFGLIASVYVIINGHDAAGVGIFGGALVTIIITFLTGTHQRKKELAAKEPPRPKQ